MSDALQPNPSAPTRSSLLYAMGRLEALHESQGRDIDALPQRVADQINPRLVAVEKRVDGFDPRLRSLERWRWYAAGGFTVVVAIVTFGSGLVPQLVHFRV